MNVKISKDSIYKRFGAFTPFLKFSCSLLLISSISRIALTCLNLSRFTSGEHFWMLFVQGVRIDFVVIGQIIIIPLLMTIMTFNIVKLRYVWSQIVRCYFTLLIVVFLGFELITPTFISEYNARPNYLAFEYLQYPSEVISMLWQGYRKQVILIPSILTIATIFSLRFFKSTTSNASRISILNLVLLLALSIMGSAVAIRSSFDHRPINPSKVAFSNDPLLNEMALNSLYSAGYSMYMKSRFDNEFDPGFDMSLERVNQLVQPKPQLHADIATKTKQKNIVILLEESLGGEFVGSLGGHNLTPNIDQLSREGIWFEQLYATGTRSVRGIEAVIAGFPPTMSRSVLKLPKAQRDFFTFACELNAQGYESTFIYGGESHFDNMKAFLLNNCFNNVIDLPDFDHPAFLGSWGVSDEDIFNKADEFLNQQHNKPQFLFVFTVSNHSPWEYPEDRIALSKKDLPHTRHSAVRYADYAIGQFFNKAKSATYWEDSVFLLVADHTSRVYGAEQFPIKQFHIPGLILGGGIKTQVVTTITSQIDLLPTVMSLVGAKPSKVAIGRDVLNQTSQPGRAILQYYGKQAYIENHQVVVINNNKDMEYFEYKNQQLAPTPEIATEIKERAIAYNLWPQYMYHKHLYRYQK